MYVYETVAMYAITTVTPEPRAIQVPKPATRLHDAFIFMASLKDG